MNLLPHPQGKERVKFKAMVVAPPAPSARPAPACWCGRCRGGVPGLARDRQAAGTEGIDPAGTPDANVHLSARADKDIAAMDMIVTATSGAGKKVLDIMKVKPGCVITDVARPLDLPPSEVAKRPTCW